MEKKKWMKLSILVPDRNEASLPIFAKWVDISSGEFVW